MKILTKNFENFQILINLGIPNIFFMKHTNFESEYSGKHNKNNKFRKENH